jgi:hypothetical protein
MMPRQLHKLNLDIVLPVEMEVDDIVELFEQSFDVWLAETFNGAVVGVDLHMPVAGHGWRERYRTNVRLMLTAHLDSWQKTLENYNAGSMTLGNTAKLCGVSRTAVYHWIQSNKLTGHKNIEGEWMIDTQELEALAKEGS